MLTGLQLPPGKATGIQQFFLWLSELQEVLMFTMFLVNNHLHLLTFRVCYFSSCWLIATFFRPTHAWPISNFW